VLHALKIYGVLRSRASRVIWAADELGIAYEHVPVPSPPACKPGRPGRASEYGVTEFLAINPNGKIPAIADDGFVMHESLAITVYLAKKYGGPLAPKSLEEESRMGMWALWAATACEPHAVQIIFHRVDYPEDKRDPAVVDAAIAALKKPLAVLEASLDAGGGSLVGGRFTVADINTAEVLRYAQSAPELLEQYSQVTAWLAACQARPAFQQMMARRSAEPE
jgi:glutathione S-transferase